MKELLAAAGTGLAGGAAGALASGGLPPAQLGVVTGISCLFGMLSSLSRLQNLGGKGAIRALAMNAGAVWLASFFLALQTQATLPSAGLLGLGIGLAGTKALELLEGGVLRVLGKQPVTREEMADMLGDLRNDTAASVAEIRVKARREAKRQPGGGANDAD